MLSSTFFKEVVLYDYVACPRISEIDLRSCKKRYCAGCIKFAICSNTLGMLGQ